MQTIIKNIDILLERSIQPHHGAVVIEDGKIVSITAGIVAENGTIIDGQGLLAVPGFIDLHIQGGGGGCVMDSTPEAIDTICATHARHGTTGLLLTPIPAPVNNYQNLKVIEDKIKHGAKGARILGVHLEGPFLNPSYTGAFTGQEFEPPSLELLEKYLTLCGLHNIRMMTIAPELPGALDVIHELVRLNIVASLGHSHATYTQTIQALDAGADHVTHMFNAMRPFHHREPGLAGTVLLDSRPSLQVIADGFHLHPGTINLLVNTKPFDKLNLITDAMRCADAPEGTYQSFGKAILVKQGKVTLADGTIAGSTLTMEKAIKNMQAVSRLPLAEVVRMASLYPAQTIKLDKHKGSLAPGKDADIVLLDKNMDVRLTMVEGQVVFSRLG